MHTSLLQVLLRYGCARPKCVSIMQTPFGA